MFEAEDFTIPLERQFQLHKLNEEIKNCTDVKQLQNNLIDSVESLVKHQHLLAKVLARTLEQDIERMYTEKGSS